MSENQELVGGRYRILGHLGKGAMGVVFMAYDPVLDRKVAIKQMTAEIAQNEDLRQRFYIEARAAARLNHPNIVTIHELQESGGEIYMVMELMEGKSLASLIEAKPVPLSLDTTLDLMAQVCDGLDYAHQHAIIHRDIKPANLFLGRSGVVKILDFGIARLGTMHVTVTGAIIGTPDYMSPEQVRGDEIDRRTDLWAAGAVLYQLLSGAKPFEGRPLAKLLAAITQQPHVPLQQRAPSVPKAVCDLVDRMLAKRRDERPASAGLVRDELRAILGRESVVKPALDVAQEFEETLVIVPSARAGARSAAPTPPGAAPLPAPSTAAAGATGLGSATERTIVTPAAAPQGEPAAPVPVPPVPAPPVVPPPVPAAAAPGPTVTAVPPVPPPPPMQAPVAPAPAAAKPSPGIGAPMPGPDAPVLRPPQAPAQAPAAKSSSRLGLALAAVLVIGLGLSAAAIFMWPSFGARVLQMLGVGGGAPQTAAVSQGGAAPATPAAAAPAATTPITTEAAQPAGGAPAAETPPTPAPEPSSTADPGKGSERASADVSPSETRPAEIPSTSPSRPAAARQPSSATGIVPPASTRAAEPTAPVERRASVPPPAAGREARAEARRPEPRAAETRSNEAPAPRVTEKLSEDTVATLAGQRSGGTYDLAGGGATVAAVNRINYVLDQYARALERKDADALRRYRPSPAAAETQLLQARDVSVSIENVNVQVNGTSAKASARRTIEATLSSGAPLRERASVTFSLVRQASGWVITEVR